MPLAQILITLSTKRCRSCVADVQESDPIHDEKDWQAETHKHDNDESDEEDDITNFHENVCQCVHPAIEQR